VIVLTALAAIFVGSTGLPPNWIDRAFFVAGAAWAFGFVAAGDYEIAFLCPHCGKRFFQLGGISTALPEDAFIAACRNGQI
jgi:hypothetical protein